MNLKGIVLQLFIFLILISCGSNSEHEFTEEQIQEEVKKYLKHPIILENKGVKVTEVIDYPPFQDVSLRLLTENVRFRLGTNNLEFDIQKFNLGEKTVSENETGFKLNKGGQNLNIVTASNELTKYYSERIERSFDKGESYFLAYLSRSYGISLKNPAAHSFYKVTTTDVKGTLEKEEKERFLAINSPLNKESYNKNAKIVLDFFLVNFDIKKGGNYLQLKINELEFKLEKWSPYVIEGLEYGTYKIDLKVFDKEGKAVEGALLKNASIQIEVREEMVFE